MSFQTKLLYLYPFPHLASLLLFLFFHWSLKKKFKYYLLFFGNLNLFLLFVLFSFRYSCDPSFVFLFLFFIYFYWSIVDLQALLVAQLVKNLPAMWETWVWSLGWERIWLQCRRPEFDTWVGKIPWGRERLPTPVLWPREIHGLYSPWDCKELDTTQWLSLSELTYNAVNSCDTVKWFSYMYVYIYVSIYIHLKIFFSTIVYHAHAQLLSHLTLWDPCSPSGIICPWDYPGKNTGVGCHFLLRGSFRPRDRTHVSCVPCAGRQIL